ncbi:carboxypeptidase E-like [Schistocerca americana]|uniref:carboxypeptidase E-like n=1 Tax=Schistocerca americana TaxID=7009 RepID=UPI001F4F6878|nr:carboxypeptidase E-like [Schistocerca americana]
MAVWTGADRGVVFKLLSPQEPLLLAAACLLAATGGGRCFEFRHHDNAQLAAALRAVHARCPRVTRLYTLSERSVRGLPLHVIEFSTRPGYHQLLKPEFKYIANMHGNEVLGRELLLKLADHLCEQWLAEDADITRLISSTRIHLLPSMNPDGWQLATDTGGTDYLIGRYNNNSVDLNRNFPDLDRVMFSYEQAHIDYNNHLLAQLQLRRLAEPCAKLKGQPRDIYYGFDSRCKKVQPETRAVMRLIMEVPFVLSANMHGGDLVANYPFDYSRSGASQEYSETPDDETFRHLALSYAQQHATMANRSRPGCDRGDDFSFGKQGGITNGAAWYSVQGGMQDFNYLATNDFEITLELGCDKYPPADTLEQEWLNNKDALIHYIWQAHIGLKGVVTDALTGKPLANAVIHVANVTSGQPVHIRHDVTSVHGGDYWRLLTPGAYVVTASRQGYQPQSRRAIVTNLPPHSEARRLDFALMPLAQGPPMPRTQLQGNSGRRVPHSGRNTARGSGAGSRN